MKKNHLILCAVVIAAGLCSIKYFTTLFDSKESAIHIDKPFHYSKDFSDKRELGKFADNIFIGEVVKESGREPITGNHDTQFTIRITQNIKGALLGDITVNQEGGYYKEKGKLYLQQFEKDSILKTGQMYLFAVNSTKSGFFRMLPKFGHTSLNTEEEKYKLIDEFRAAINNN